MIFLILAILCALERNAAREKREEERRKREEQRLAALKAEREAEAGPEQREAEQAGPGEEGQS